MSILQKNLSAVSRSKLYLTIASVSLILLFLSVSQTAYVVTGPSDLFGLASHFPVSYWVGLALITLCSILAFLDGQLKSDAVFIFILAALGLYLFGIATLVEENVRHPTLYGNIANTGNILATGHVDVTGRDALILYASWPAAQILHASLLHLTDLTLEELLAFVPFIWVISFTLLSYAVGRRIGLSPNSCFLLSFLALSSYWLLQSDSSQQGLAILLLLLCFPFVVSPNPRRTVAEAIIPMLGMAALILTHGLTSLALVMAVVALSLWRRIQRQPTPFAALFPVLFLTWYIYEAQTAFRLGVKIWWAAPLEYILRMGVRVEGLYEPTYTYASALIAQYSRIGYILIYGILAIAAIIHLLMGRVKPQNRPWVTALLVWAVGLGLAGFLYPNKEMYIRLYMLGLVPVIGIILTVFSARRVLVALMLLSLLLYLPARYGTEGYYGQVYSTELAGVRFFGDRAGAVKPWIIYRTGDLGVLPFYNPDAIVWPKGSLPSSGPERFDVFDEASYLLNSDHGGVPDRIVDEWVELGGEEKAALIYVNGDFSVYESRLARR